MGSPLDHDRHLPGASPLPVPGLWRSAARPICSQTHRRSAQGRGNDRRATVDGRVQVNDVRKGFVYRRVPHVTLRQSRRTQRSARGCREEIDRQSLATRSGAPLRPAPGGQQEGPRHRSVHSREPLAPPRSNRRVSATPKTCRTDTSPSCRPSSSNLRKAGIQNTVRNKSTSISTGSSPARRRFAARGAFTDADGGRPGRGKARPRVRTVDADQVSEAAKEATREPAPTSCSSAPSHSMRPPETAKEFPPERQAGRWPRWSASSGSSRCCSCG